MGRERDGKLSRTLIRCNLAKVSEDSRPIGLPRPIHVGIFYWAISRDLMGWPPQLHGAPGVKQQLAAVRMLFDWRITGQIVPANPAAAVRGPEHIVKTGKIPVLDGEEWRKLLASIPTTTLRDLHDRALIATLTYSFARITAALKMRSRISGRAAPAIPTQ
jgi:integrase